jgi:hypothetical protein
MHKDRDLALKLKELQDVTLILSKKDKEILMLKKEIDTMRGNKQFEEEAARLKDYIKTIEVEYKQKNEKNENVLERLKEITSATLKI